MKMFLNNINPNNWEILGTAGVDSGQLLLIDPAYLNAWEEQDFEDVRIYQHKATGARLQYQVDFGNYQDPIRTYDNQTMNQLRDSGEWEKVPYCPAGGLGFNTVAHTTLSKSGGGEIGPGVAFQTGHGDGHYLVMVRRNENGRIMQVFIDFETEDDE